MTTPRKRISTTNEKVAPSDPVDELNAALRAYRLLQPDYQVMTAKMDEARRRVVAACEACGLRSSVLR